MYFGLKTNTCTGGLREVYAYKPPIRDILFLNRNSTRLLHLQAPDPWHSIASLYTVSSTKQGTTATTPATAKSAHTTMLNKTSLYSEQAPPHNLTTSHTRTPPSPPTTSKRH